MAASAAVTEASAAAAEASAAATMVAAEATTTAVEVSVSASGIWVLVQKRGSVGRTIDVTRYRGYDELRHDIACMFGIEGLLETTYRTDWKLVYVDHENDVLLVGEDPWEEFVNCVKSIKILSATEVQQMSLDGDIANTRPQNQALAGSGLTDVRKRGSVGRTIDVTRYRGYDELRHDITCMFGIEGLLETTYITDWKLVYVDHENDVLLVGEDPWEEFVNCVKSIKILSATEVQHMSLDGDMANTRPRTKL